MSDNNDEWTPFKAVATKNGVVAMKLEEVCKEACVANGLDPAKLMPQHCLIVLLDGRVARMLGESFHMSAVSHVEIYHPDIPDDHHIAVRFTIVDGSVH